MKEVDDFYNQLQTHIEKMEEEFISKFIPASPSDDIPSASEYSYSVQSYCILCHAAFEEFVERVAIKVVDIAVNEWTIERKPSDTVLALICHTRQTSEVSDSEEVSNLKAFDYLRLLVEEAKRIFSTQVHGNHGISMKYLRRLLIPAGLDVPANPDCHTSLARLAKERGSYAHKNAATTVLSPEDAKGHVANCLLLCKSIKEDVNSRHPT